MTIHLSTVTDIIRLGAERYPDRIALESAMPPAFRLRAERFGGQARPTPSAFALSASADKHAPSPTPHAPRLTYRDLWNLAQRGARALRGRGLERGDRVLLASPPGPDWLVAFFSILEAGLVAVPVPDGVGAPLVAAVAVYTRARLCIVGRAQTALGRVLGGVPRITVPDLLAESGSGSSDQIADFRSQISDGSPAVLAFTSGSTARPRAVELTHANLVANLRALMAARQSEAPETMLSMLPPAHLFELVVGQLAPLAVGGRIVYAGTLLPNRLVDAIRDHAVTRVLVVPALLEALCRDVLGDLIDRGVVRPACRDANAVSIATSLAQLDPAALDGIRAAVRERIGGSLHGVGVGGAAIAPGWSQTLTLLGIDLDVGYGLTEAGPLVSLGWASQCPAGSVGRPLPGVAVRISHDGEILVRSAGVMRAYFGDIAASSAALEGGWLRTGDRGRVDAGGFLYIAGRIKEAMVTAAGDTLHPEEVEPYYASRLFAEHCVVPLRGPDGNDLPALVVVVRDPDAGDDAIEREFAELRAAAPSRYRVARMVRRVEPLPRTLVGKIKRRELGDLLAAKEPVHAR